MGVDSYMMDWSLCILIPVSARLPHILRRVDLLEVGKGRNSSYGVQMAMRNSTVWPKVQCSDKSHAFQVLGSPAFYLVKFPWQDYLVILRLEERNQNNSSTSLRRQRSCFFYASTIDISFTSWGFVDRQGSIRIANKKSIRSVPYSTHKKNTRLISMTLRSIRRLCFGTRIAILLWEKHYYVNRKWSNDDIMLSDGFYSSLNIFFLISVFQSKSFYSLNIQGTRLRFVANLSYGGLQETYRIGLGWLRCRWAIWNCSTLKKIS